MQRVNNWRPRRAQIIISEFTKQIRSQKYLPGSKLPSEQQIKQQFGVSRSVAREAIASLQSTGLVETKQGIGTFVLSSANTSEFTLSPASVVTVSDILSILELRISLETEAAHYAAERHTNEQLIRMNETIQKIQSAIDSNKDTKELDFEFHNHIADASGNRYFSELLRHLGLAILPRTRLDVKLFAGQSVNKYLNKSNNEHRLIYKEISKGNQRAARNAMQQHLSVSYERIRRLYIKASSL